MTATKPLRFALAVSVLVALFWPSRIGAQQNQVMGELRFSGTSKIEKDAGVWIDGQYVGYLKELNGNKKIMLLPGEHQLSVRQAGYKEFALTVVSEPGQTQTVSVRMEKDLSLRYPGANAATLKLNVTPERAAVFVDEAYLGHASDFGGAFHSMLVTPGKHRVKVDLPGYRTFETEINVLPGQKAEIKTDLVKGSIEQAGPLVKQR